MKKYRFFLSLLIASLLLLSVKNAYCGKGGHYTPGVADVRDFIMPPKSGFCYAQYNPYYYTNAYYGHNGEKVRTLSAGESIYINGVPVDVSVDANIDIELQSFGIAPAFFYVFDTKILGASYGVSAEPYYGYVKAKIKADVTAIGAVGGIKVPAMEVKKNIDIDDSDSGMGDLSVSPLWLDWGGEHYDTWIMYDFYAPVGKYDSKKFTNIGRGFWSHEISLGAAYYIQKEQATAFVLNVTYEINQRQSETDVTPGQNIAFEYGISQYLIQRLEVCVSGYSMFQVTDDSGGDARGNVGKSDVHAIGGQLGYWIVKDKFCVEGRYLYEYAAQDRTKGQLATINFYYIF